MQELRQSTAVTVPYGPFVDSTDGVTPETGLTIQKAHVRVKKNGGDMAAASADQGSADAGAPHDEIGVYDGSLNTTDTGTLGRLRLDIQKAGAAPWFMDFMVITAAEWDAKHSTGIRDANVTQWLTGTPSALISGRVDVSVGAMQADVMTAAAAAADLTTELQNGLATAAALTAVDDFIDTEIASIISTLSTIAAYLDTEVAAILAAVDTEVGAIKAVTDLLPDAGALSSLATQASVTTIDDFLDTEIAAIKAKTDNLPSDPADHSVIVGLLGTPAGLSLAADIAAVKAETALIVEDTGTTLPATLATMDGKLDTIDNFLDTEIAAIVSALTTIDDFLDTEVAAIKAKTDGLPADPADASDVAAAITAARDVITALLPAALVGGRMDSNASAIGGVSAAAVRLALSAGIIIPGTVDSAGFSPTTTEFEADDITTAAADHYNGRVIIFTSGSLIGQATSISDYSLATGRGHFTVPALTAAPADNVTFIIV